MFQRRGEVSTLAEARIATIMIERVMGYGAAKIALRSQRQVRGAERNAAHASDPKDGALMSDKLKRIRSELVYNPVRRAASRLGFDIVRAGEEIQEPPDPGTPLHESFAFSEDNEMDADHQFLLTPRQEELDTDRLIEFLDSEGLSGIYIPSFDESDLKICFLERDKSTALNAIALFCAREGARLRYRVRNQTSETTDLAKYLGDFSGVDNGSMRIISLRSVDEIPFSIEFWEEEEEFYTSAGRNYLSRRLWKETAAKHGFFEPGSMKNYASMLDHPHVMTHQFPIDLVFTWVNSDDPDWQKLYQEHSPEVVRDGTSLSRFHSRDELKYALRSWDAHAPFIRHVFVVSNCAPPAWLDIDNERITWVPHEDILPASALPTFSSHAIETSLHKIPGLADFFIYSNDDFLLTRDAYPEDFYFSSGIAKVRLEPYGMVNGSPTDGHADYLNGARNANKLIEDDLGISTTMLVTHSPQPLRKDVMQELEAKFGQDLNRTAHNKFRAVDDVALTGYLHANYAVATGKAISDTTPVQLIQQNHRFRKLFADLVEKRDKNGALPLSICLNDGAGSHTNMLWNNSVASFLDDFYPDKSSFEK